MSQTQLYDLMIIEDKESIYWRMACLNTSEGIVSLDNAEIWFDYKNETLVRVLNPGETLTLVQE